MKKKLTALLALTLALCLLCGCSGADLSWFTDKFRTQEQIEAAQKAAESGEEGSEEQQTTAIKTEILSEVESFGIAYQREYGYDPYNCESLNNRVLFSLIYEPLFAVTKDFRAVGILAAAWSVSEDGLVTTVCLRPDVRFHNGQTMTAQDVIDSLACARGSFYYGARFRNIVKSEIVGDYTIRFTTAQAYECLPMLLDFPIIPAGSLEEEEHPAGTGPYVYAESKLVRNADWWQSGPALVEYPEISITDAESTPDIRDQFEYENVNLVLTDPNSTAFSGFHNDYELWDESTTIMQYIGYNIGDKVFSNYGLRSAITFAIDREKIAKERFGGFAQAAVLPCTPTANFYDSHLAASFSYDIPRFYQQLENAAVKDMDHDEILDLYVPSLGYNVQVSGTMIVCSSSYQRVQAATDIVTALNMMGFNLELKTMEYSEYRSALQAGNFDLYYGEVRLSNNFDLTSFFTYGHSLCFGELSDSTMQGMCSLMLANTGNSYNLYKRILERGYITPVLFKSHAAFTTRGVVTEPTEFIDWFLPAYLAERDQ